MKIRLEIKKPQCNTNREAAKILALLSGKFDKYEYLTCEEILPSSWSQIIEQAKFTYSHIGKALDRKAGWCLKSLNISNKTN